jgi:hypothetical protein
VLLEWFHAGLIGIMHTDSQRELPPPEGQEVLANFSKWSPAYSLLITDAGESALA